MICLGGLGADVVDSVRGWWKFDETSGTIARDSGPYAYQGNLQGGMTFASSSVAGQQGTALAFDGTDDFVQVSLSPNLAFSGQQSFSISVWVYFEGATNVDRWILQKGDNFWLWYKGSTGEISFGYDQGGPRETFRSWSPVIGRWYHFSCVHDAEAGTLAVAVDKVQIGSTGTGFTASLNGNDGTLTIGRRPTPVYNYFQGRMDDLRIFNKVLSAAEISTLATSGGTSSASSGSSANSTGVLGPNPGTGGCFLGFGFEAEDTCGSR